jgi:hypothetical protein
MAERERKRQETLAQLEADRLRAEERAAAEAARFQAMEEERKAAVAKAAAEQEAQRRAEEARKQEAEAARVRAEAAAQESARAEKAAKEREWQALLEAEAAEQERQLEAQRQAEAARQREEQERIRAEAEREKARLEAERLRREEEARLEAERLRREEEARLEAERLRREEEARLEAERLRREEEARLEAERLRREEEARLEAERLRREEEARLEAERLRREEEEAAEKAAVAAALAEEEARRQAELERLAAVRREELAREEAEAEAQRRKLEEQRKKRQSFLDTTDSFSTDFAAKSKEKEDAILSVKHRENTVIASEINAQSNAYVAPAPKQRSVFDDLVDVPQSKPTPVVAAATTSASAAAPSNNSSARPASTKSTSLFGASASDFEFPTDIKPTAKSSNFENITSSLFSATSTSASPTVGPAAQSDLFGESTSKASKSDALFGESDAADSLFANRTFAVKTKKSKGGSSSTPAATEPISTASKPTGADGASATAAVEESNVDWDDLEATGKTDGLTGEMEQLWKARQIDITTRRKEFGGAVCYGLGGIFSWQMYSTAESRDSLGKPYVEYIMRCQWGTKWENMQPWLVARRYREFDALDASLRRDYPQFADKLIPLPGKGILTLGVVNLTERTSGIEHYIIHILNNVPQVRCTTRLYENL